jgi:hypothetical protein
MAEFNQYKRGDGKSYSLENLRLLSNNLHGNDGGGGGDGEIQEVGCSDLFEEEKQRSTTLHTHIVWFFVYFGWFSLIFTLVGSQRSTEETCSYEYSNVLISGSVDMVFLLFCMYIIDDLGRTSTQLYFYGFAGVMSLIYGICVSQSMESTGVVIL